ncbi:UDP-3-O-(3-hydroxymyristoyl)glucosamine N-acyltransferase [Proteobacteria bacterium 005FR1]|nr:UDP-3-O-(3-hydroxymyristoyl)glucosamine N-acyltransferase [Proteobacteria bacterium 005FR1]
MAGSVGLPLADLAAHVGAKLAGDPDTLITGIATLQDAHAGQIAFLANPKYRKYLSSTLASAVILAPDQAEDFSGNALVIANPYHAYARLTALFARKPTKHRGIHPSAVIAESVILGQNVSVGPLVTIEENVEIGDGTVIGAGCFIGEESRIGADSLIHPNVTVSHGTRVGARAIFHSGVVIGGDGFGFAPHESGWTKIHHLANVTIGDDVELGAGTCVDRGALSDTVIASGVKIDNMVQVAHGVKIGENTVIAGCTAIAGSTEIGANCVIAGGVGIVGHITIAEKVTITAMSLVSKSITEPGSYSSGTPITSTREWRKLAVRFGQLDEINRRLKTLENTDQ